MKRCAYCGRQIFFGEEVWLVNNEDMYCTAECLANAMEILSSSKLRI